MFELLHKKVLKSTPRASPEARQEGVLGVGLKYGESPSFGKLDFRATFL